MWFAGLGRIKKNCRSLGLEDGPRPQSIEHSFSQYGRLRPTNKVPNFFSLQYCSSLFTLSPQTGLLTLIPATGYGVVLVV